MDGYIKTLPMAWSGWRLDVAGAPAGGQYHGLLAGVDPRGPWSDVWGGTVLAEGEDQSDYVFRSSAEMKPRPNASGGANTVEAYQALRTVNFAEAPGGYFFEDVPHSLRGLGLEPRVNIDDPRFEIPWPVRWPIAKPKPVVTTKPIVAKPPVKPPVKTSPKAPIPVKTKPNTVKQPPPPQPTHRPSPAVQQCPNGFSKDTSGNCVCPTGAFVDSSGYCTTDWHNPYSLYLPPQSPAPAPTVAASPSDFLPADAAATADPGTSAASSSLSDWLTQQSIIPGVNNEYVLAGGALLAFLMFSKGGRR